MKIRIFHIMIAVFLLFSSCKDRNPNGIILEQNNEKKDEKVDPFIEGNKKIVSWENEEINLFLKRYGWNTTNTGTGLRIQITKEGRGDFPLEGDTVTLKYKTILLTGEVVYSSKTAGDKVFVVDKSEEIAALHEAVKLMRKGSKARVVIPSHLAYGVAGDGNKISGRASLAMYLELTDLNKKDEKTK
jgi:FKBP-type peptidyl-prolyl cis-trans isomerase FkpA